MADVTVAADFGASLGRVIYSTAAARMVQKIQAFTSGQKEEDVRETLKACGLSLKKRNYSDGDRERFAQARKLFEEGTANSYDDIANYFKSHGMHPEDNGNGIALSGELVEHLRLHRRIAV
jgi:hypothetical protein